MKTKNNQKLKLIVFLVLVIGLAALAGFYIYKRTVSADTTLPSWIDSATATKYNSVWSTAQKQQFLGCMSNGYTTKSTLTAAEQSQFGANSVVFEGQAAPPNDPAYQIPFYQSKYRIVVTPQMYTTNNGSTSAKFKFNVSNPTSSTYPMRKTSIRLSFWHVEQFDYYVDGVTPHYWAADQVLYFPNQDNQSSLAPGQQMTIESNVLNMTNESFYTVSFATEMYGVNTSTGAITWTGGGTASSVNCIVNPIPIASLRTMAFASVTPTQTTTSTATSTVTASATRTVAPPTVTPTPSVTSTTAGPGDSTYNFPRGFSVFGATANFPSSRFADNGLYVYKFDGVSNSWVYWPGMTQFNLETGKGYYAYAASAKSASLPLAAVPTGTYSLTKGWNMLYNIGDKSLSSLQLSYNGVTKSAQEMINSGTIHSRVFIIDNDQATQACSYFKLLGSTNSVANCSSNTLAVTATLNSAKAFWVYVF